MHFIIEPDIFERFPGIRFVVAVARGACPEAGVDELLGEAWRSAAVEAVKYGNPQSHPNISPWGERMKDVGAPRKKFPCSIEALTRRAGKDPKPVSIHPLVDFYNAISLKYIVPAGGFDIDELQSDLCLRFSREGDTFTAMDGGEALSLPPGEVSYTDGSTVITRHFVWKQSRHTLLTPESRNIFFVSEILGELPYEIANSVRAAFAEGLVKYFGAELRTDILNAQSPAFEL